MSNEELPVSQPEVQIRPVLEPLPEPMGGAIPEGDSLLFETLSVVSGLTVGVGILFSLMTPCVGATRSSRLLRDGRQLEAEQAISHIEDELAEERTADNALNAAPCGVVEVRRDMDHGAGPASDPMEVCHVEQ